MLQYASKGAVVVINHFSVWNRRKRIQHPHHNPILWTLSSSCVAEPALHSQDLFWGFTVNRNMCAEWLIRRLWARLEMLRRSVSLQNHVTLEWNSSFTTHYFKALAASCEFTRTSAHLCFISPSQSNFNRNFTASFSEVPLETGCLCIISSPWERMCVSLRETFRD